MLYALDELSRLRTDDLLRTAAEAHRVHTLTAARRWTAVARWAARSANRATDRLT